MRLKNDVLPYHVRLIFAGHVLKERKTIFECQIGHKSTLHVVLHTAVKDKLRQYFGDFHKPEPAARESEPGDRNTDSEDQNSELEDNELEAEDQDSEVEDQTSESEIQRIAIST